MRVVRLVLLAFALLFCERAVAWGQQPRRHRTHASVSAPRAPKVNRPRMSSGAVRSPSVRNGRQFQSDRQRRGYFSRQGTIRP